MFEQLRYIPWIGSLVPILGQLHVAIAIFQTSQPCLLLEVYKTELRGEATQAYAGLYRPHLWPMRPQVQSKNNAAQCFSLILSCRISQSHEQNDDALRFYLFGDEKWQVIFQCHSKYAKLMWVTFCLVVFFVTMLCYPLVI